eukprot:IDg3292t1
MCPFTASTSRRMMRSSCGVNVDRRPHRRPVAGGEGDLSSEEEEAAGEGEQVKFEEQTYLWGYRRGWGERGGRERELGAQRGGNCGGTVR